MTEVVGFPERAVRFYAELERDNAKTFWAAHKKEYDEVIRYGGTKESGVGREGVRYAIQDFTYERVLVLTGLDL